VSRAVVVLALLVAATAARAGVTGADERPALLAGVGLEQRLGQTLPLDAEFRDESGAAGPLRRWLAGRPVVLALVYFGCPMLCSQVRESLTSSLKPLSLDVGRDFDVLTVSFDPRDGPEAARAQQMETLARYGRAGAAAGWHFLTGDADAIRRLTDAVGFRYAWDPVGEQFVHVAMVAVVTPDGRIARYFPGIEYPPRDVRLALVEASAGKVGTLTDRLVLFCYRWNASTGRYTPIIGRALQVGAALTIVALGTLIVVLRRQEGGAS